MRRRYLQRSLRHPKSRHDFAFLDEQLGWTVAAGTTTLFFFVGGMRPAGRRRFYQMVGATLLGALLSASVESKPVTLKPDTTYYWKVINTLTDGSTVESDVSSFTTGSGE